MNARKQREKNRRRANKLAREAWDAADQDRWDLAVKIIGRAVDLNPANPLLWHDQGSLLIQLQEDDKAAESFQAALQIAPDFAEAYASLAAMRHRQGKTQQAVALQREAVRHAPHIERHVTTLAAYEALLKGGCGCEVRAVSETQTPLADAQIEVALADWPDLAVRLDRLDWTGIESRLTDRGLAHVRELLTSEQCDTLRKMYDQDALFAKTVTMNKSRFGKGVYRYFAAPLPPLVDAIRHLVYPSVARIVNRWQHLLQREDEYPTSWSAFRSRCAAAGQTTPSPLLLRYEEGGFNALHQDVRGDVFFPVQLVVVLSRRGGSASNDDSAFTGGEFLFCDQPERKASDRCAVPAGLGDAILFCTRARLVSVGGAYGLQGVKHGLNRIASGTRYALGIPFHDFT